MNIHHRTKRVILCIYESKEKERVEFPGMLRYLKEYEEYIPVTVNGSNGYIPSLLCLSLHNCVCFQD